MEADRFDRLTKTLSERAPRRLALRGLGAALAAALGFVALISDPATTASAGGSGNRAIVGGGGRRRRHDHDHHRRRKDRKCRPKSRRRLCHGKCDQIAKDGCGGRVDCACKNGNVCLPGSGACCPPDRLCAGESTCCPDGSVCGPGDACCPIERVCVPSNACCAAGFICAAGGGVCCLPEDICQVGGVQNACCSGTCVNGVCQ